MCETTLRDVNSISDKEEIVIGVVVYDNSSSLVVNEYQYEVYNKG